ncbi:MAG TPA: AarF/UbiB family protein [Thermomicrobiales bacterium]|nr:AarF/UbiB family protein [Thermomicrobiales bacterium]
MITSRSSRARAAQIIVVFFRYRIMFAALPWRRHQPDPVQLRLALEHLGGTWIKLGQMLAMRFDLLPVAHCRELFKLLNDVKPFPYEDVRDIIRQELGDDPESIFLEFDPTPFAAASIGQVHRAVLPSGRQVAVKVQRPEARQVFAADIQLMYALSNLLSRVGLFGAMNSRQVIAEFAKWTADELDYVVEARQAIRLRENAAGDSLQSVPQIWGEFTSSRVLTIDLVEGVPLIEIMHAVRNGDHAYLDRLRADGHDLRRIVRHLDWNMLNQIHVFGFFHADLHPANLFVLRGDAIGYVDFGVIGKLSGEMRQSLTRYASLFFEGDSDRAITELIRWVAPASVSRVAAARAELVRVHDEFMLAMSAASQISAKGAGLSFAVGILDIARRHGIVLVPDALVYLRTLIATDTLRYELAPDYDLHGQTQRFFGRLVSREVREFIKPQQVVRVAHDQALRLNRLLDAADAQLLVLSTVESRIRHVQERVRTARRWLRSFLMLLIVGVVVLRVLDLKPGWTTAGPLPESASNWLPWLIFGVVLMVAFGILVQSLRLRDVERPPNED